MSLSEDLQRLQKVCAEAIVAHPQWYGPAGDDEPEVAAQDTFIASAHPSLISALLQVAQDALRVQELPETYMADDLHFGPMPYPTPVKEVQAILGAALSKLEEVL